MKQSEEWERTGGCRECGYDRQGIEITDACPECGTLMLPVDRWLRVSITQFLDTDQPGWVAAEFVDAAGHRWQFREKIPILTDADLWADSIYPQTGWLECREVSRAVRDSGRRVRVTFGPAAPAPLDDVAVVEVLEEQLES